MITCRVEGMYVRDGMIANLPQETYQAWTLDVENST